MQRAAGAYFIKKALLLLHRQIGVNLSQDPDLLKACPLGRRLAHQRIWVIIPLDGDPHPV